ncbi:MAG TPA: hypothetical protein VGI96_06130 [Streptosporangiaceae bacterium]
MSDRIGGAFPDERAGRPSGPGGAGRSRPADGRTSGGGTRGGAPGRPSSGGRPTSAGRPASAGRFESAGGRPDSYRERREDRAAGDSALPPIPESITEDQLSRDVREELGSLSLDRAITVGRYLVAAELATDPEQGYRYGQAAKRLAARVGVAREVAGITAYRSGRWAEALTELQAGRRMTGRNDYLPLMADSERGLGRLDRALDLVHSAEARRLPRAAQVELRIVESGIRRDQGLFDAAVLALQVPELTDGKQRPWSARLFYAYGEALLAVGRTEAAREAFSRAVVADEDEETDALARLDELDGITVQDLEDDDEDDEDNDEDEDSADLDDKFEDDDEDDDALDPIEEDDLDDEEEEPDESPDSEGSAPDDNAPVASSTEDIIPEGGEPEDDADAKPVADPGE